MKWPWTPRTPAGGHEEDAPPSDPTREAATAPPAGQCPKHPRAAVTFIDPTGGDPFMGGPVLIPVCVRCGREVGE